MKRAQLILTLTAREGSTVTVAVRSVIGPFAIHRPAFAEDKRRYRGQWMITHMRTTFVVCHVRTLKLAMQICAHLVFISSWQFDHVDKRPSDLAERVRPILESYGITL